MKLTQTVKKGGCAAKVPALILREILAGVKFPPLIEGVTVDGALFDDAAIFNLSPELSMVQTLDFFTPILDSAYDFGAVAAANALSDVYAMGGKPKTCLAILAAPMATMENSVIQEVLQGASDVITKSKSSLVGGHSIDDDTLKFGLSVTGLVHPDKIWKNDGALVHDLLILTKPIGTGTLCAGLKREAYTEDDVKEAVESMKRLNNIVDFLISTEDIHAATDITGFGLAGHSVQMAQASKVSFHFKIQSIPLFSKTLDSLKLGHLTKAHKSNDEYTKNALQISPQINDTFRLVMFDPQTSGGLLLSVSAQSAEKIVSELKKDFPGTTIIGSVTEKSSHDVYVE
ncbi:MAG: selenide, water dikinase SelD [Bacteriovoracaceae bacterium]